MSFKPSTEHDLCSLISSILCVLIALVDALWGASLLVATKYFCSLEAVSGLGVENFFIVFFSSGDSRLLEGD